jgi:vacuolar protein sorting-associated protein 13A/C
MAKRIILRLLDETLGQYVVGVDKKDLEVSLLRGRIRAVNLTLRPEAFAKLELPLTVAAGHVGSLSLDVPWTALMSEPVVLTLERVFVVLRPSASGAFRAPTAAASAQRAAGTHRDRPARTARRAAAHRRLDRRCCGRRPYRRGGGRADDVARQ